MFCAFVHQHEILCYIFIYHYVLPLKVVRIEVGSAIDVLGIYIHFTLYMSQSLAQLLSISCLHIPSTKQKFMNRYFKIWIIEQIFLGCFKEWDLNSVLPHLFFLNVWIDITNIFCRSHSGFLSYGVFKDCSCSCKMSIQILNPEKPRYFLLIFFSFFFCSWMNCIIKLCRHDNIIILIISFIEISWWAENEHFTICVCNKAINYIHNHLKVVSQRKAAYLLSLFTAGDESCWVNVTLHY